MAAAAGSGSDSSMKNIKQKIQKVDDGKGHVDGCMCDKCTYFQVTPVANSVQDGDAKGKEPELSAPAMRLKLARLSRPLVVHKGGKGKVDSRSGLKPTRYTLPYSFAMNCAAGGLITSLTAVTGDANTAEWAAFQALYDEYRILGGKVDFGLTYQTPAGANTVDAMFFVMGYDPVDGSSLTGVRNGTELSQHTLRMARPVGTQGTTSANLSMSFNPSSGKPIQFKFRTPPVAAFAASQTAVALASGAWKILNNSGSNNPDGYLKVYGTSDNANVVTCVTGIIYLDIEFRSRK